MKKQYKIKYLFFLIFLILTPKSYSQTGIEWEKNYGGSFSDYGQSIRQTNDGGYIIVGSSNSNDGDINGNHGNLDCWVVKIDELGNIEWEKSFGGSASDSGQLIQQTNDGGYIIAGSSRSDNGDVSGNNGNVDYWIIKIDESGNIEWEKNYGGSNFDSPASIQQTNDGGYIIAGISSSSDGDVIGNYGDRDSWVLKIDETGNIEWGKNYGGSMDDPAVSIQQTNDGGYIFVALTVSSDIDVSENYGGSDYWVVKIDESGSIEWEKNYGGTANDSPASIQQTNDDGYIIVGSSTSNNGDVSGNNGDYDYWILKIDESGNMEWGKNYGSPLIDFGRSIQQTNDGGYIIAGVAGANGGDVSENHGAQDYWILKLDESGNMEWEKNYGGTANDTGFSIQQTIDNGYIIVGNTESENVDVNGNNGFQDYWILKLKGMETSTRFFPSEAVSIFPNPTDKYMNIITPESLEFNVNFYDLRGNNIFSKSNCNLIDIAHLNTGIYLVEIRAINSGKVIFQTKLIKQ